jgi:hypothetical protein
VPRFLRIILVGAAATGLLAVGAGSAVASGLETDDTGSASVAGEDWSNDLAAGFTNFIGLDGVASGAEKTTH